MSLGRHMGPWEEPTSATAARLISASSSATASTAASHTACSLANCCTTPYTQQNFSQFHSQHHSILSTKICRSSRWLSCRCLLLSEVDSERPGAVLFETACTRVLVAAGRQAAGTSMGSSGSDKQCWGKLGVGPGGWAPHLEDAREGSFAILLRGSVVANDLGQPRAAVTLPALLLAHELVRGGNGVRRRLQHTHPHTSLHTCYVSPLRPTIVDLMGLVNQQTYSSWHLLRHLIHEHFYTDNART